MVFTFFSSFSLWPVLLPSVASANHQMSPITLRAVCDSSWPCFFSSLGYLQDQLHIISEAPSLEICIYYKSIKRPKTNHWLAFFKCTMQCLHLVCQPCGCTMWFISGKQTPPSPTPKYMLFNLLRSMSKNTNHLQSRRDTILHVFV